MNQAFPPLAGILACLLATTQPVLADDPAPPPEEQTDSRQATLDSLEQYLGQGGEKFGAVVDRIFQDHGTPDAFITGQEFGAAIAVGVRYGRGTLHMPGRPPQPVYWQGPSLGFDLGANTARVFILVYGLTDADALFQRYPGIDGSLYASGGIEFNYLKAHDTVLVPIRLGTGWRQGVNAGYMDLTREAHANPF